MERSEMPPWTAEVARPVPDRGLIEPIVEGPHGTAFRMGAIREADPFALPRPGPFSIAGW